MKKGFRRSLNVLGVLLFFIGLTFIYDDSLSWRNKLSSNAILWLSIPVGLISSSVILLLSERLKLDRYWNYCTQFILSYLLAFQFIGNSMYFFEGYMYRFSHGKLGMRVRDLQSSELFHTAISHSGSYKEFLAFAMVGFGFLLCFRQTRALGTIGALAITSNIYIISSGFDFNSQAKAGFLLALSVFLLLSQWKFFINTLVLNKKFKTIKYPLARRKNVYNLMNIGKAICFIGTVIFFHFDLDAFNRSPESAEENPLVGIWRISDPVFQKEENQIKDFLNAEMLYFDSGVHGFIEHNDTLTRFKYLVDPEADQFDMYDFHEYRDIDLKGKFELLNIDTILFRGKNHKDSISIKLIREKAFDRFAQDAQ